MQNHFEAFAPAKEGKGRREPECARRRKTVVRCLPLAADIPAAGNTWGDVTRDMRIFRDRGGLTLVEMITVLFIVSILVAFVTGLARHAMRAAEVRRARADLHLLADALERYYLRFGAYPEVFASGGGGGVGWRDATDLLRHVRTDPAHVPPEFCFSNCLPRGFTAIDPWQRPYRYRRHMRREEEEEDTFDLGSQGPDANDIRDDIVM